MANVGTGKIIYDLRKQIQELQEDLHQLGVFPSDVSEMVDSANLLRLNEYLVKVNDKKTELLTLYEKYSTTMSELLSSVFDIQMDLKEILKEQSMLISNQSISSSELDSMSETKPKTPRKTKPKTPRKTKPKSE